MEKYIIVFVTFPNAEEAKDLVIKLLKARLIACANISSQMESFFLWNGQINSETEVLVYMKTKKKTFNELADWIKTHHSYDVPEIIALPILMGSREYFKWIEEEAL
jgi:periplasmic divalent cation tolerance protein